MILELRFVVAQLHYIVDLRSSKNPASSGRDSKQGQPFLFKADRSNAYI